MTWLGRGVELTKASLLASTLSLAMLAGVPEARADEKQVCVVASERGQQLKSAGKLSEAREQFMVCSRPECPKLIQQDCTQWTSEVLARLPSVVPGAKDKKGRDVVDVRVAIDGKVAAETLDGKAIVLDPGVHTFRFETKGAPAVEEQVVVKPGEKDRIVTVTFAVGEESNPRPSGPAVADTSSSPSSPPYAAYVVGGLGIVALGAALIIDLGASSDARNLRDTCAPSCAKGDVDAVQSRYTIAGVTAGIGGALVITGVVLFILNRSSSKTGANRPVLTYPHGLAGRSSEGAAALFTF
jgi:hypothetical protein